MAKDPFNQLYRSDVSLAEMVDVIRELITETQLVAARVDKKVRWQRRLNEGLAKIAPSLSRKLNLMFPTGDFILQRRIVELQRALDTFALKQRLEAFRAVAGPEDQTSSMVGTVMDDLRKTVESDNDKLEELHETVETRNDKLEELHKKVESRSDRLGELQEGVVNFRHEKLGVPGLEDHKVLEKMKWFLGKLRDTGYWDDKEVMRWLATMATPAKMSSASLVSENPHLGTSQTELDTLRSDGPGSRPFIIYSSPHIAESPVNNSDAPFSTHVPDAAVSWLEANYEHPQIEAIRVQRIGGPIATMISPYEPALVIFGSTIAQPVLFEVARCLSELSHFPVMIQPHSHNPVTKWKAEDDAEISSLSTNQDTESFDAPQASDPGFSSQVHYGEVSRLRGGAGSDSESDSELHVPRDGRPLHSMTYMLKLARSNLKSEARDINIMIESNTGFTVQAGYQNKRRPQVISHTELKVQPRIGVHCDRSYSRVGFVIDEHPEHRIFKPTWIDEGFGPPGQTLKTTGTELKENNVELDPGLATVGKIGHKRTKGNAHENTSDRVSKQVYSSNAILDLLLCSTSGDTKVAHRPRVGTHSASRPVQ
ncbi:hypothetical protein C8R47DRAFT_244048 [Mycena vitilis]|nr:hypothetical protein C8R47DRAFT_244048 [Mycena vitilis]